MTLLSSWCTCPSAKTVRVQSRCSFLWATFAFHFFQMSSYRLMTVWWWTWRKARRYSLQVISGSLFIRSPLINSSIPLLIYFYPHSSPAAGEGPAKLSACHVQSEQGDPQRPGPRLTGRLQAHVAHWGPCHSVPDPAAHTGCWYATVKGRPEQALQLQGIDERVSWIFWFWFCLENEMKYHSFHSSTFLI